MLGRRPLQGGAERVLVRRVCSYGLWACPWTGIVPARGRFLTTAAVYNGTHESLWLNGLKRSVLLERERGLPVLLELGARASWHACLFGLCMFRLET